jgi:hypothetical protein
MLHGHHSAGSADSSAVHSSSVSRTSAAG